MLLKFGGMLTALVLSTDPALAFRIDAVDMSVEPFAKVILSDIPERASSVTCVIDDGNGRNVAIETDLNPDVVHELTFWMSEDAYNAAENITCWLGRDRLTKVARRVDEDRPPYTEEEKEEMLRKHVPKPEE